MLAMPQRLSHAGRRRTVRTHAVPIFVSAEVDHMAAADPVRHEPMDRRAFGAAGLGPRRLTELSLRLRPVPYAVTKARHAVRDFCREHALDAVVADAELLTSELVTNAVAHARYLVTLHAAIIDGELAVTVTDDAAGPADGAAVQPGGASAGGRGLFIVAALALDWGLDTAAAETTAWFRLAH
jgi:anti-sigma regulatory factor (Ser/Thr protein kinase)